MLAAMLCLGWVVFANIAAVAGTWQCSSTTPDGVSLAWNLRVAEQDGKLTGITFSDRGETLIVDPKLEGENFSFKVLLRQEYFELALKVAGDKLEGTWKGGGMTGSVKGTRQS